MPAKQRAPLHDDLRIELADLEKQLDITKAWDGPAELLPDRISHLRERLAARGESPQVVGFTPSGDPILPCHGEINLVELHSRWMS